MDNKLINDLYNLKFSDEYNKTINKKYLNLPVHIALERANINKDEKSFYQIVGNDTIRKQILKKHIKMTESVFGKWNFSIN